VKAVPQTGTEEGPTSPGNHRAVTAAEVTGMKIIMMTISVEMITKIVMTLTRTMIMRTDETNGEIRRRTMMTMNTMEEMEEGYGAVMKLKIMMTIMMKIMMKATMMKTRMTMMKVAEGPRWAIIAGNADLQARVAEAVTEDVVALKIMIIGEEERNQITTEEDMVIRLLIVNVIQREGSCPIVTIIHPKTKEIGQMDDLTKVVEVPPAETLKEDSPPIEWPVFHPEMEEVLMVAGLIPVVMKILLPAIQTQVPAVAAEHLPHREEVLHRAELPTDLPAILPEVEQDRLALLPPAVKAVSRQKAHPLKAALRLPVEVMAANRAGNFYRHRLKHFSLC